MARVEPALTSGLVEGGGGAQPLTSAHPLPMMSHPFSGSPHQTPTGHRGGSGLHHNPEKANTSDHTGNHMLSLLKAFPNKSILYITFFPWFTVKDNARAQIYNRVLSCMVLACRGLGQPLFTL